MYLWIRISFVVVPGVGDWCRAASQNTTSMSDYWLKSWLLCFWPSFLLTFLRRWLKIVQLLALLGEPCGRPGCGSLSLARAWLNPGCFRHLSSKTVSEKARSVSVTAFQIKSLFIIKEGLVTTWCIENNVKFSVKHFRIHILYLY